MRRVSAGRAFRHLGRVAPLLVVLLLVGCSDGDPILFPAPDAIEAVLDTQNPNVLGQAGEVLPSPVRVEVKDEYGNPIPDVEVRARVSVGGGSLEDESFRSNDRGFFFVSGWRMGERPGPNVLEFETNQVEAATIEVESGPGPAAELRTIGDDPPAARVASTLENLPRARLADRFDNPIPGETLRFSVSGSGSLSIAEAVTDQNGEVALPAWTLGPRMGGQILSIRYGSGLTAVVRAEAEPGPPAALAWTSPNGTRAEAGLLLPIRPTVQITDAWDNGLAGINVQIDIVEGQGSITAGGGVTDEEGLVTIDGWTLDPLPGPNALVARATGLANARLDAEGMDESWEPEGRYFTVETVHITQASQRMDGGVSLIPGRPGLLRAFVRSTETGAPAPPADIVLHQNGVEFHRERVVPSAGGASTLVEADGSSVSWDLELDPEWIRPGLGVRIELDPDGEVGVVTRRFDEYPADGAIHEFEDVQELPPLHVRLVAMRDSETGTTADLTEDNVDDFIDFTRRVMPVADDTVYYGGVFTTDLYNDEGVVHTAALSSLLTSYIQTRDSIGDHYLHGIFPGDGPLSFAGVAYLPPSITNTSRQVGMTYDRLPGATETVAHELGHNLSLPHAPCGNPAGPDPNFPYPNAQLGVTGWDRGSTSPFRSPVGQRDLMSYCGPRWISDYNYELVLDWRAEKPTAAPVPYVSAAAAATERILVGGIVTSDSVHLQPVLSTTASPAPPVEPGPYRLVGLDDEDDELFSYSFRPTAVSHAPDPGEGHFAWVLPISSADRARLHRIEVRRPDAGLRGEMQRRSGASPDPMAQQFSRVSALPDGLAAPEAAVRRPAGALGGADVLQWNPEVFPAATVWDRATGELVGLVRRGALRLDLWEGQDVEIRLEDGLRSFEWRDGTLEPLH